MIMKKCHQLFGGMRVRPFLDAKIISKSALLKRLRHENLNKLSKELEDLEGKNKNKIGVDTYY